MDEDFSKYKMNSFSDIEKQKELHGKQKVEAYIDKIYAWLLEMNPGQIFDIIRIPEKERHIFILTVCLFISENNYGYILSNDYTQVIRKKNED